MGNFIQQTEHKGAVRSVQLLAYFTMLAALADVVLFVAYSLKTEPEKDSYVFFVIVLLSVLGSALHSAVGISLPHSGKFSYYKPSIYAFLISDVIGLGSGIRALTVGTHEPNDLTPLIFNVLFYLGCLVANTIVLRFFFGSVSAKAAFVADSITVLLILLHFGDIVYSMVRKGSLTNPVLDKYNVIRLVSNFVFLLTAVSMLIVIRIMPTKKNADLQK